MTASTFYDRVFVSTATIGTGDITPGAAAASQYLAFSDVSIPDGTAVTILITDVFNASGIPRDFELDHGTYHSAGPTISRDTVIISKINNVVGTSKINMSGTAQVCIVVAAEDLSGLGGGRTVVPSGPNNYYVRTAPASVTISHASPAVVSWSGHGLAIGDAVVFSAPRDCVYGATITIASPGVVTATGHGYSANDPVRLYSTGLLPTGLVQNTTYYVKSPATNTFQLSATSGGAAINTSGSQSGTHMVQRATFESGLPAPVVMGNIYYVISAGFGVNSFEISASVGGSAINTTTAQAGSITACTGNDNNDGASNAYGHAKLSLNPLLTFFGGSLDFANNQSAYLNVHLAASTFNGATDYCKLPILYRSGHRGYFYGSPGSPWNCIFRNLPLNVDTKGTGQGWKVNGIRAESNANKRYCNTSLNLASQGNLYLVHFEQFAPNITNYVFFGANIAGYVATQYGTYMRIIGGYSNNYWNEAISMGFGGNFFSNGQKLRIYGGPRFGSALIDISFGGIFYLYYGSSAGRFVHPTLNMKGGAFLYFSYSSGIGNIIVQGSLPNVLTDGAIYGHA